MNIGFILTSFLAPLLEHDVDSWLEGREEAGTST